MASHRKVLYVGMTSALDLRIWQHRTNHFPDSFTARYRVHRLVHLETFNHPLTAIRREKQIKGWTRAKKIALIEEENPRWQDLSAGWGHRTQILRPKRAQNDASNESLASHDKAPATPRCFELDANGDALLLRLASTDGTNRLTRETVCALTMLVEQLSVEARPLILTGNAHFFSAGAELREIAELTGADAYEFAKMGQGLMNAIADFPAPTIAAVSGYCLGGGLDLALACHRRIAAPNAIFGHRGAALGLITGWGGTQRLPRLIGKGLALQMFCAAEKLHAQEALRIGLVDEVADDPVAAALRCASRVI